jgi:hypothetical protein
VEVDEHLRQTRHDLQAWAAQNLHLPASPVTESVDLSKPGDVMSDVVSTLLFPVTRSSYRDLYSMVLGWSTARRREVIDVATQSRTKRDELLRSFRTSTYVYDLVIDIGAYRDLHRHRRCQQFRQDYTLDLGWDTPAAIAPAGLTEFYEQTMQAARTAMDLLPQPGSQYLLPFAARSRFLFKMDFAEAEYICRLRSGVKGHFSYRKIAWAMKEKMESMEPELAQLMEATPPWVEDPLTR